MIRSARLALSRGEIWLVNFSPSVGDEIQKKRPAVVMSIRAGYSHRLQIVVPITSWQARFAGDFWMVPILSTPTNGLDKDSAANAFQVKSVSEARFDRKLGTLTAAEMEDISAAIVLCIGFRP
jgi:mRNA interferase MazF